MDKIVPQYYKKFGDYVNKLRAIPGADGLKPVERRILLSAFKIAKNKFIKCAALDGYVTGNYHPHASCYGTIVSLANQGWLDKQGTFGSNIGTRPEKAAASRYTECKFNNELDETFEMLDYVDWQEGEYPNVQEPVRIPFKIPLCLIGDGQVSQGMGFGYKTYFPKFKESDLVNRLLWLLKVKKKEPVFPPVVTSKVLSTKTELRSLLTKSYSVIKVRGNVVCDNNNCIHLKSWQNDVLTFQNILNRIQKIAPVGYHDLSSKDNTDIVFEVTLKRKKQELTKKVYHALQDIVTRNVTYFIYVIVDNKITKLSVDEWLVAQFNFYKKTVERMLKDKIKKLEDKISKITLLKLVQKNLNKVDLNKGVEECSNKLAKLCNTKLESILELIKVYPIKSLMTIKSDFDKVQNELNSVKKNLNNIDQYVVDKYLHLSDKS